MKKVTMTFVVSDGIADYALIFMKHDELDDAAAVLSTNCEESDYNIEEYTK